MERHSSTGNKDSLCRIRPTAMMMMMMMNAVHVWSSIMVCASFYCIEVCYNNKNNIQYLYSAL